MRRRTKVLLWIAGVLVLLVATARFLPGILWGDGIDWSHVRSIKGEPTYQDARLLRKAWALPVAARYRTGLDYQENGSFCGPTSLVNVLRSTGERASQEKILEGTGVDTVLGFLPGGITLDELRALTKKKVAGRRIEVLRGLDQTAFRNEIARANDLDRRLIANFHRGPLFGEGGGHHSPIAGYLEAEDLVFVLDVNEDYAPWLVKTDRFFEAVDTMDVGAKKKRGLLRIEMSGTEAYSHSSR